MLIYMLTYIVYDLNKRNQNQKKDRVHTKLNLSLICSPEMDQHMQIN